MIPGHPEFRLRERFGRGTSEDAVAPGDDLVGSRQPQVVAGSAVDDAPAAKVLAAAAAHRFLPDRRPAMGARQAARLVRPIVELFDDIVFGTVDIEVEA